MTIENYSLFKYYLMKWDGLHHFHTEFTNTNVELVNSLKPFYDYLLIILPRINERKEFLKGLIELCNCKRPVFVSVGLIYSVLTEMIHFITDANHNRQLLILLSNIDSTVNAISNFINDITFKIYSSNDKTNTNFLEDFKKDLSITQYLLTTLKDGFIETANSKTEEQQVVILVNDECHFFGKGKDLSKYLAFYNYENGLTNRHKEYIEFVMNSIVYKGQNDSILTNYKNFRTDLSYIDTQRWMHLDASDNKIKKTKEYQTIVKHLNKLYNSKNNKVSRQYNSIKSSKPVK